MKKKMSRRAAAWAVAITALGAPGVRAQDPDTTVEEVLDEVQKGIYQAQQKLQADKSFPKLSYVEVELNTVLKKTGTTGFKILIFSFGGKWEKEAVQKVTLRLQPYGAAGLAPKLPLSDQLTQAIVAAAQGVGKAPSHAGVPLALQKLAVEISFVVRTEKSGGLQVKFGVEPVSVELEGKGEMKKEALQKLTVVFEKPTSSAATAKP